MLELTAAHGDACRMHGGRPCTQSTLNLLHLKAGGDAGGFAEHDAGRAVFFMAHRDGALHRSGGNRFSCDREVHVDGGKHLRVEKSTTTISFSSLAKASATDEPVTPAPSMSIFNL